jgi:hypothetical protein
VHGNLCCVELLHPVGTVAVQADEEVTHFAEMLPALPLYRSAAPSAFSQKTDTMLTVFWGMVLCSQEENSEETTASILRVKCRAVYSERRENLRILQWSNGKFNRKI